MLCVVLTTPATCDQINEVYKTIISACIIQLSGSVSYTWHQLGACSNASTATKISWDYLVHKLDGIAPLDFNMHWVQKLQNSLRILLSYNVNYQQTCICFHVPWGVPSVFIYS